MQPHPRWFGLLMLCLLAPACRREAAEGGGPLPPVDQSLQARDSIRNPFDEIAPGVFSRVVFRTPPAARPSVEVRDVELARGKTVARLAFPGAAVIEVRQGRGSMRLATTSREIQAGAQFGLSQGDSLQFANTEAGPLTLRVYLIGSR